MKTAVVVFPGSNCDHDAYHVLKHVLGQPTEFVWHKETSLSGFDTVILPGGFAHGDYLRCGAIARFSPIMDAVIRHARRGGTVVGICNGFQVLTEAGLLPGALLRNRTLSFLCRDVWLRVEAAGTAVTSKCRPGDILEIPIGHGEGNFFADEDTLDRLEGEGRVLFRYVSPTGVLDDRFNFNGSARAIAGIMNDGGNVFGFMPHPERNAEPALGNAQGRVIFESLVAGAGAGAGAAA
ncbi:MAG TPA: phosphoribosylformylglycinamidine synthase subunit PurQ [Patescibacteria group bacterium]|jgi:phosphoribosylformylglycinamidine synthase|nr:phosphoribosylformylglycinamidine synthase subunit PurQ [Patescibacteria group bacterium]